MRTEHGSHGTLSQTFSNMRKLGGAGSSRSILVARGQEILTPFFFLCRNRTLLLMPISEDDERWGEFCSCPGLDSPRS